MTWVFTFGVLSWIYLAVFVSYKQVSECTALVFNANSHEQFPGWDQVASLWHVRRNTNSKQKSITAEFVLGRRPSLLDLSFSKDNFRERSWKPQKQRFHICPVSSTLRTREPTIPCLTSQHWHEHHRILPPNPPSLVARCIIFTQTTESDSLDHTAVKPTAAARTTIETFNAHSEPMSLRTSFHVWLGLLVRMLRS